jgi:methyltransferase (TIGR00027 family)
MFNSLKNVTYQVPDIDRAKQWYREILEREPVLDSPFYVKFLVGEAALILVPAANGAPHSNEGTVAYWGVEDIEVAYRRLLDCGATSQAEISTSLNIRIARVVDPFDNIIGLTDTLTDTKKGAVENQPSESALTVAFCRALAALEERAELRGPDYLAELFLTEDRRRPLRDRTSREWVIQKLVTPELYGYFRARTIYLDDIFEQALRENLPQIVFLGAGYDTRAYRFRELIQETRIFELDIQPTQQRKKELLQQANVRIPDQLTFVPTNFKTEPIEAGLLATGFDQQQRTLFIWEGVTYYLPLEVINDTLTAVKLNTPPGSILCFDYMTAPVPSAYTAEPFQFWIAPDKIEGFLAERGYGLVDHLRPAEIEKKYLTLADGSVIGKTLPFFCFAQSVVMG